MEREWRREERIKSSKFGGSKYTLLLLALPFHQTPPKFVTALLSLHIHCTCIQHFLGRSGDVCAQLAKARHSGVACTAPERALACTCICKLA